MLRRRAELAAVLAEHNAASTVSITAMATISPAVEAADGQAAKLPTVAINAYNGGPIRVPGYRHPVVVDVSGVSGTGRSIPLLRAHDPERIVGHGTAEVDGAAINVSGTVSGTGTDAEQVTTSAGNGFPWQASIGLMPTRVENVAAGKVAAANGKEITGPAHIVRAGRLYEVSIVALGADDTTATAVAAQMQGENAMSEVDTILAELTPEQKTALKAKLDGKPTGESFSTTEGTKVTASSTQAVIAAARAREQRSQAYGRIIASAIESGLPADEAEAMVTAAESQQMTEAQFELEVLRASRRGGPAIHSRSRGEDQQDVLEAALAISAGQTHYTYKNADGSTTEQELYSPELLQKAQDKFPNGISLMELVVKAARRNGYTSDTFRQNKAVMQAAFTPVLARGASTYDLSGILSNVANKSLKAGFNSVENSWREISTVASVKDFKEVTHYALTGDFELEQVAKGGELKHATMGEQSYSNKAETYGKIFAITRTDFINDDLSAFSRIRTGLGRGSAISFNKVFWTEFLADVTTFYTSGRGNYQEGSSTALSLDSLTAAELLFLNQTDPDGNPLGVDAAILLTPNSLATTAVSLASDTEIRVDGSSSKTTYTTRNPHAGKWRPVKSSYLNAAAIPNGSALHWFLLASPMDMPVIESVFLNGRQLPIVETSELTFDLLGVQMRAYHDFGVRKQEYRGGVRSKGEA